MSEQNKRRQFLKLGAGALAAGPAAMVVGGSLLAGPARAAGAAEVPAVSTRTLADLPKANGPRLVIVGGGTSGLTIAKYAKREYPKFDVVLVEKRDMYASCFSSNLLYSGIIDLEFLANHSYLDAAANNGYTFFNATVTGLDRGSKRLATSAGDIAYDFLVLAPGLDYDYGKIGVEDVETRTQLRQRYPGGFTSPTEHVTLRRKIREFEGGLFIQTVPSGNYRCAPAPYERACMIASVIRRNKLKAKVLVLDANPEIKTKAAGFHAAFDELYKDIIEWKPSSPVTGVDVGKRIIRTEFDDYAFDEAAIYPNVRASTLIETLGLMAPGSKSNQKEADIDTRFYNFTGDPYVYVTGDSRPQPYSKSGSTANSEGHYIARLLAARAQGKEIEWASPSNLCYSMVSADPQEAIWVTGRYVYDAEKDLIVGASEDTKAHNDRTTANGLATLEWARGMYRDMFKA